MSLNQAVALLEDIFTKLQLQKLLVATPFCYYLMAARVVYYVDICLSRLRFLDFLRWLQ